MGDVVISSAGTIETMPGASVGAGIGVSGGDALASYHPNAGLVVASAAAASSCDLHSASTAAAAATRDKDAGNILTYLPLMLLRDLEHVAPHDVGAGYSPRHAALLYIDVVGFSSISNQLQFKTEEGSESLNKHLNMYFDRLIRVILEHGGDIILFSGDAILVAWASPIGAEAQHSRCAKEAVLCGAHLLRVSEFSFAVRTTAGTSLKQEMSVRVGAAEGRVISCITGGVAPQALGRWRHVFLGPAVDAAGRATHAALPCTLAMTPKIVALAAPHIRITYAPLPGSEFLAYQQHSFVERSSAVACDSTAWALYTANDSGSMPTSPGSPPSNGSVSDAVAPFNHALNNDTRWQSVNDVLHALGRGGGLTPNPPTSPHGPESATDSTPNTHDVDDPMLHSLASQLTGGTPSASAIDGTSYTASLELNGVGVEAERPQQRAAAGGGEQEQPHAAVPMAVPASHILSSAEEEALACEAGGAPLILVMPTEQAPVAGGGERLPSPRRCSRRTLKGTAPSSAQATANTGEDLDVETPPTGGINTAVPLRLPRHPSANANAAGNGASGHCLSPRRSANTVLSVSDSDASTSGGNPLRSPRHGSGHTSSRMHSGGAKSPGSGDSGDRSSPGDAVTQVPPAGGNAPGMHKVLSISQRSGAVKSPGQSPRDVPSQSSFHSAVSAATVSCGGGSTATCVAESSSACTCNGSNAAAQAHRLSNARVLQRAGRRSITRSVGFAPHELHLRSASKLMFAKAAGAEGGPLTPNHEAQYVSYSPRSCLQEYESLLEKIGCAVNPKVARQFLFDTVYKATRKDVVSGELRTVSTVFVKVRSIPKLDNEPLFFLAVHKAVRLVQQALTNLSGIVNKVVMDDKGVIIVVLFGIPGHVHDDDVDRSLLFCFKVARTFQQHGLSAAMGVSRASVFCGVTGARWRREYTVLGNGVNIAARLMTKADDILREGVNTAAPSSNSSTPRSLASGAPAYSETSSAIVAIDGIATATAGTLNGTVSIICEGETLVRAQASKLSHRIAVHPAGEFVLKGQDAPLTCYFVSEIDEGTCGANQVVRGARARQCSLSVQAGAAQAGVVVGNSVIAVSSPQRGSNPQPSPPMSPMAWHSPRSRLLELPFGSRGQDRCNSRSSEQSVPRSVSNSALSVTSASSVSSPRGRLPSSSPPGSTLSRLSRRSNNSLSPPHSAQSRSLDPPAHGRHATRATDVVDRPCGFIRTDSVGSMAREPLSATSCSTPRAHGPHAVVQNGIVHGFDAVHAGVLMEFMDAFATSPLTVLSGVQQVGKSHLLKRVGARVVEKAGRETVVITLVSSNVALDGPLAALRPFVRLLLDAIYDWDEKGSDDSSAPALDIIKQPAGLPPAGTADPQMSVLYSLCPHPRLPRGHANGADALDSGMLTNAIVGQLLHLLKYIANTIVFAVDDIDDVDNGTLLFLLKAVQTPRCRVIATVTPAATRPQKAFTDVCGETATGSLSTSYTSTAVSPHAVRSPTSPPGGRRSPRSPPELAVGAGDGGRISPLSPSVVGPSLETLDAGDPAALHRRLHDAAHRIPIPALTLAETCEFLTYLYHSDVDRQLAEIVHRKTGGVVGFICHMVWGFIDEGLVSTQNGWTMLKGSARRLPDGFTRCIVSAEAQVLKFLDTISEEAASVVQACAVLSVNGTFFAADVEGIISGGAVGGGESVSAGGGSSAAMSIASKQTAPQNPLAGRGSLTVAPSEMGGDGVCDECTMVQPIRMLDNGSVTDQTVENTGTMVEDVTSLRDSASQNPPSPILPGETDAGAAAAGRSESNCMQGTPLLAQDVGDEDFESSVGTQRSEARSLHAQQGGVPLTFVSGGGNGTVTRVASQRTAAPAANNNSINNNANNAHGSRGVETHSPGAQDLIQECNILDVDSRCSNNGTTAAFGPNVTDTPGSRPEPEPVRRSSSILSCVRACTQAAVGNTLATMVAWGLIAPVPGNDGMFQFPIEVFRDVVYQNMLVAVRRDLHKKAVTLVSAGQSRFGRMGREESSASLKRSLGWGNMRLRADTSFHSALLHSQKCAALVGRSVSSWVAYNAFVECVKRAQWACALDAVDALLSIDIPHGLHKTETLRMEYLKLAMSLNLMTLQSHLYPTSTQVMTQALSLLEPAEAQLVLVKSAPRGGHGRRRAHHNPQRRGSAPRRNSAGLWVGPRSSRSGRSRQSIEGRGSRKMSMWQRLTSCCRRPPPEEPEGSPHSVASIRASEVTTSTCTSRAATPSGRSPVPHVHADRDRGRRGSDDAGVSVDANGDPLISPGGITGTAPMIDLLGAWTIVAAEAAFYAGRKAALGDVLNCYSEQRWSLYGGVEGAESGIDLGGGELGSPHDWNDDRGRGPGHHRERPRHCLENLLAAVCVVTGCIPRTPTTAQPPGDAGQTWANGCLDRSGMHDAPSDDTSVDGNSFGIPDLDIRAGMPSRFAAFAKAPYESCVTVLALFHHPCPITYITNDVPWPCDVVTAPTAGMVALPPPPADPRRGHRHRDRGDGAGKKRDRNKERDGEDKSRPHSQQQSHSAARDSVVSGAAEQAQARELGVYVGPGRPDAICAMLGMKICVAMFSGEISKLPEAVGLLGSSGSPKWRLVGHLLRGLAARYFTDPALVSDLDRLHLNAMRAEPPSGVCCVAPLDETDSIIRPLELTQQVTRFQGLMKKLRQCFDDANVLHVFHCLAIVCIADHMLAVQRTRMHTEQLLMLLKQVAKPFPAMGALVHYFRAISADTFSPEDTVSMFVDESQLELLEQFVTAATHYGMDGSIWVWRARVLIATSNGTLCRASGRLVTEYRQRRFAGSVDLLATCERALEHSMSQYSHGSSTTSSVE